MEARQRVRFPAKIPRLTDHYFQSRPVSDMSERCLIDFDEIPEISTGRENELVAVDDALKALAEIDARKASFLCRSSRACWAAVLRSLGRARTVPLCQESMHRDALPKGALAA